ncbi:GP88 family protein [Streptomyces sp. NPDC003314]
MTNTPRWLLTQNSDMRQQGIYNWSIPAWAGTLPDGRNYNTCPGASACAPLCYARQGSYRFPNVRARHEANLMMILDDLPGWEAQMTAELQHKRYQGRWVRVHDAGDFFSRSYTDAWLRVMRAAPGVRFYAYTKSVSLFREAVEPDPPENFKWVYSLGGREDHLIDLATERHVDIFPDEESLAEAGYTSRGKATEGCLVSVLGPQKIGIAANKIRHLQKKQGKHRWSELQRIRDRKRRGPGKPSSEAGA